ncbi:hypothetical protein Mp_1g09220 [Marchantia polymorpha subsp. ruderalis]|uniref:Uncharacterized protein n=2 Tax=Marchantia polymorpha TaxID=3197 RepID=A0AAF6AN72_MARPO|nr:hypothetical protein MARPO_0660s0001 [Marchantia polymorpha]BBM97892.1 hypothetical protein Mp_1g09220 [Marchantia polymorpha subsp. ruderalis]|eukprot:PTQ26654.1 hypothetical protein MARPO_0660s0001 [Marchantia polymorpha]
MRIFPRSHRADSALPWLYVARSNVGTRPSPVKARKHPDKISACQKFAGLHYYHVCIFPRDTPEFERSCPHMSSRVFRKRYK